MKPWQLILGLAIMVALVIGGVLQTLGGTTPGGYSAMTGPEVYDKLCSQCHGNRGTAPRGLANSYEGKRAYWDEGSLLKYIADPRKMKRTQPHLRDSNRVMQAIASSVPMDARKKLVAHVLGLMDKLEPKPKLRSGR